MNDKQPRVLTVGHCSADHAALAAALASRFDAAVDRAVTAADAHRAMSAKRYDLALVNRLFDSDQDDGVAFIARARRDGDTVHPAFMLVSNFDDAQQRAVQAGALPGFGKAALHSDQAVDRLSAALRVSTATDASP